MPVRCGTGTASAEGVNDFDIAWTLADSITKVEILKGSHFLPMESSSKDEVIIDGELVERGVEVFMENQTASFVDDDQ